MIFRISSFASFVPGSASSPPLPSAITTPSKRHPSISVSRSKTARAGLISMLALIILFRVSHKSDELAHIGTSWRGEPAAPVAGTVNDPTINWSQFAYVQYVTDEEYLCNSVMMFKAMHRLKSRPDRVMLYPSSMFPDPSDALPSTLNHNAALLVKARDEYKVKLMPIEILSRNTSDETWSNSFTKLLAFNLTSYTRVLSLDSDALLLQPMDELFLLPPGPVAMPLAYWLDTRTFSSYILLVQPSVSAFTEIVTAIASSSPTDYDMEILNRLYSGTAMVLPHRPYGLLTQEFRAKPEEHERYLGDTAEQWDAKRVFEQAKYVHFSDWPMTKPWLPISPGLMAMMEPRCWEVEGENWEGKCVERDIWRGLYREFRARRESICFGDEER